MAIVDICIDSRAPAPRPKSEMIGSAVLAELGAWDGEIEVSYRDGCRHVRRFIPVQDQDIIRGPMKLHLSERGKQVICFRANLTKLRHTKLIGLDISKFH